MNEQRLETTDIFRGAFLLSKGGKLCGVRVKNNGRRQAFFQIQGKGLEELEEAYRSGRALVNPLQLKESLNELRDILFGRLRENEGRGRHDRKRANRGNQDRY